MIRNAAKLFLLSLLAVMTIAPRSALAEDTQERSLPSYNLSVSFDLKENLLRGTAKIVFPESGEIAVSAANLIVVDANLNGRPVEYSKKDGLIKAFGKGTLEINYQGVFRGGRQNNLQNTGVVSSGVVNSSMGYPLPATGIRQLMVPPITSSPPCAARVRGHIGG